MKGYEIIILGIVYTLITGLAWSITGEPINATIMSIGIILWGIIQIIFLDKDNK